MIYKMKLTDSSDSMTFDLLEVPIVDKDIEGAVDNTTLDGNVYTDYLWLKKQYMQKWAILCDAEYTQLRGFYTRQFENATIPTYRLYYGTNNFLDKTVSGEYITTNVSGIEQAPITDISLLGNTEQTTYSGKNLISARPSSGSANGITWTLNSDGSVTVSGTATANQVISFGTVSMTQGQTYTLSGCPSGGAVGKYILYTNVVDPQFIDTGSGATHAVSATATAQVNFIIYNGRTINGTIYPMLEIGSSASPYEPYVGGTASPNPDYPQAIDVVTGEQTVKITGKNLLNITSATGYTYSAGLPDATSSAITVNDFDSNMIDFTIPNSGSYLMVMTNTFKLKPNTEYAISFNRQTTLINNQTFVYGVDNGTYSILYRDNNGGALSATFTSPSNGFICIAFGSGLASGSATISDIQIEEGSATAYEPYQGQSYEVNLGKNLFDKNGANGKYQATLSITSESIKTTATNNNTGYVAIAIPNSNNLLGKSCTISYNAQASVGVARTALYCSSSSALASVLGSYIIRKDGNGDQTISFTFPSAYETGANCFVLLLYIQSTSSITAGDYATYSNIQLEAGSQATAYAPYFTPIELAKIGTYQDYIWNDNGTWKVHKETGKASISISGYTTTYTNIDYATFAKPSDMLNYGTYTQVDAICESAISPEVSGGYDTTAQLGRLCTGASRYVFWVGVEKGTTQATAETLLNGKALYYALATPTDTEITNSALIAQLDALEATKLFLGVNNITTETENEQPTMNIKYTEIYDRETDVISTTAVRLTLTDDGVINNCGCRQNVQLTMRETVS